MKPMIARMTLLAAALAAACGSDDDGALDSAMTGEPEDVVSVCPPGTPEFMTGPAGLTDSDEALDVKVRIDDADAVPPAKNYNTWQIVLTDLADAPLPNAQISWACAWMTAHGHGANPREIIREPDGRITLEKLNLSMSGGWQVRLWVDPTGMEAPFAGGTETRSPNACTAPTNAPENITFDVCIPRQPGDN